MPTPRGCYCNWSDWDLLVAILEQDQASFDRLQQIIQTIEASAGGGGDVVGPAGASDNNIAVFDGATGKLIKDSGIDVSTVNTTLQSGSQNIGSGVSTISVVFGTPFLSVPDVVVSISRPAAEPLIDVNIDEASITVNGFTASLGATTDTANYKLKWMAN